MLKIAYTANVRLPTEKAHGIQIMKMCEAFSSTGAQITLFIPRRLGVKNIYPFSIDPFSYYGVKTNFKIKKIFCFDLLALDRYTKSFLGYLPFFLEDISFAFFLWLRILFSRFDFVYTRSISVAWFLCFLSKSKVVFEIHDFPKTKFSTNFLIKVLKKTHKIVAITEALGKKLKDYKISKNKIFIAPDGVSEEFFVKIPKEEAREKLAIPTSKKVIMYTGNLYPWKGVYRLAEASKYLSKNYLIYIVGGSMIDNNISPLQTYINTNNIKSVKITGHVSPSLIPYYLAGADVLILPNSSLEPISNFYTSPLKLFEYMASQRPIIASNLPSIMEILDKNLAFMIEPDNAEILAQTIINVFKDYEKAEILAQNAYKKVKLFTWNKRAENILNFINKS